jgi:DivIVA domain-containing protein
VNAKDIVSKEFDTVKRGGYDAAEVDTFLKDVSIEYKKLQNENEELEKKLEVLAEKIREYRKDEDALRDALLIAKKQGIAVVNEAKEDAEKIRKDAQEKAEKTIKDADALAAKKKELGEKNLAEANAKAKQTVDDANAKAAEIHTIMMQQTEREQIVLQRTRKEVQDYTTKILAAYSAHIENIKAMPKSCENEFVINTVKEVEARKPEDSAFAKKPAPAKPAPEARPAPAPSKPAPEAKPAPAPEKKAEEKVTGESVLFSLKNEKEEKNAPTSELEFGKNK